MALKNLDLDSFKEYFSGEYEALKRSLKEEKFDQLLNEEGFKENIRGRTVLRDALKKEGFFEERPVKGTLFRYRIYIL
jgi:hypothetical protein